MDKEEFAARVTGMERSLYCVARSYLRCQADCEDALQSAVLRAWERLNTLREERYFNTWLTRILINECIGLLRRQKRESPDDALQPAVPPADCDRLLWDALWELDEKYRIVTVLFYRDGYAVEEIARALRLPSGTVKNRLFRARKQLRGILDQGEALTR